MTRQASGISSTVTIGGGPTVGRIGYGAMQLTGPKVWGEYPDRDRAIALLREVVDAGVTFIDTADVYGPHSNEELIREALHPYPDDLVIATKGGFVRGGPEYRDMSAVGNKQYLRQAAYMSMRRLGLDRIDLYYLHTPTMTDAPFEEIVETLAGMRQDGLIRHIGLSNVSAEQLRTALTITDIAAVTVHYNVAVRLGDAVRAACAETQHRVLALASGRRPGGAEGQPFHAVIDPIAEQVRSDPAAGRARLAAASHTQRAADPWHDERRSTSRKTSPRRTSGSPTKRSTRSPRWSPRTVRPLHVPGRSAADDARTRAAVGLCDGRSLLTSSGSARRLLSSSRCIGASRAGGARALVGWAASIGWTGAAQAAVGQLIAATSLRAS